MPGEFGGDMVGGGGCIREIPEHGPCLLLAIVGVGLAQHHSRTRFVQCWHVAKARARTLQRLIARQGPTRERACEFGHIPLGVAASHAQRVQFQNLACQVFVEPRAALLLTALQPLCGDAVGS